MTVPYQASLSMGFSRQGYCSGLSFPSLGDLADTGIEPCSPSLQADALPSELQGKPVNTLIEHKQENLTTHISFTGFQLPSKTSRPLEEMDLSKVFGKENRISSNQVI